jgi:hypothetical protein
MVCIHKDCKNWDGGSYCFTNIMPFFLLGEPLFYLDQAFPSLCLAGVSWGTVGKLG